jgi:twitching motility protein PilT
VAAIDSLLGILDMQKAHGLVLVEGKQPEIMGGKSGALTMPPLNATMMKLLVDELLTAEDLARIAEGAVIERALAGDPSRPFTMTARLESGRPKIVVRRGQPRARPPGPADAPPVVAASPEASPPPPSPEPPAPFERGPLPLALMRALDAAIAMGASDVILSAGRPPLAKRAGRVETLAGAPVSDADLRALAEQAARGRAVDEQGSADFALEHGTARTRFRVNVFRQLDGLAAVLRPIWDQVPSLADLNLPAEIVRTVAVPSGLVLMAGATGSGKSTTLAALVEHLARQRACHIVTLEDPIEYRFTGGQAVVHQREVGAHVSSFAAGLRAALRESPDVLLLGEMRDPETIALALSAAETGHLVLSTLHSGTAAGAIDRMVNASPESDRASVRAQLAGALRFVLTQQLLPGTSGGRVPVVEVLSVNQAVAAQIRDGRTQLLATQIELGTDDGMIAMNQALQALVRAGRITRQTALGATLNPGELERLLGEGRPVVPRR